MKTIKAKINFTMFLILGFAIGFGYLSYTHYQKMDILQNRVSESLFFRDEMKDLNLKNYDKDNIAKLKEYKYKITDAPRKNSVSNIIQAYNSNNPKLLKSRIDEFEKNERLFFRVAQWTIKKQKKEAEFYLFLATFLPLFGLFGLIYYLNFGILSPLQTLSNRMMEFLIDQYTFRFSSPANNEIGNLERTFNSLAQKVLNNIDELKALDRAKSEFVSIASHELRTPLTSIKGSLGLLSNSIVGTLDDDAKDMVNVAEQETDRLVRLINDMLDLAKIESRSLSLKKDWYSIQKLFETTKLGMHGFASASQVNLAVKKDSADFEVYIDCDRIQQVLTNLISNAIKYSPQNGIVTLNAQVLIDGSLEVVISDSGQGISDENQQLIFEKFRQATDSSNHLVKGTGLGLAISKALVQEHQGQIGVRSKLGNGSHFYFTLPEWRKVNPQQRHDNKAA